MALKQLEILLVGSSIAVRPVDSPNDKPYEYYPVSTIHSITSLLNSTPADTYPYAVQAMVMLVSKDRHEIIRFDVQDVSNQATWLATEAGLMAAVTDINSWITAGISGGGSTTPGSLIVTDNDALGGNGTYYIDSASGPITGETYKYLVVNSSAGATFSVLNDSAANDMLTDQNYSGNVIEKGMIIRAANGEFIEDITVLSGSVIGVK